MRLREVERIACGAVPGSGAARVSLLSIGLLHSTYRVDRDGRAFSMRLATAPSGAARRASARDGTWVLRVLQLASDRKLAPPLVCGDTERGITVHDWVEGRALPSASVRATRNIERIATLLRRVHALPVPVPARTSSPAVWMQYYSAALAAKRRAAKRAATRTVRRTEMPSLTAAADIQLARFQALPDIAGVVCHSDLHRLNVLEYRPRLAKAKALLLLDWEYAHVSEPLWDLAGWSANNDLPDDLKRRLLTAYLGRAPQEADWTRCNLLGWLYDFVCLLWSELYLNSRHGGGAADVARRAAVLRARLIARGD